ncbi:serine/threonine protein kinase [Humitalea rosea]|uniref:Serine/threonine protein kinase n=1 Tax=Humitalea rosea TaxID=990373 RepID=A0A2W7JX80_9PROT|nr:serine/threonine-protein kinase [Humitalea rosea]PZW40080.1 serine/threonine protein kinase [Humitalea rosea]
MDTVPIAGRFAVRDLIGQGASGIVLEALDLRLRRLVAIKLVHRRPGGPDLARIAAEARMAARLSHPHIVTVHDAGDGPDYAWIAMDLVIGEPLSALLARDRRLAQQEAAALVLQLLAGLGHAHARGIVHRDVKPANILLAMDAAPGPGQVRLGDFGVARMGNGEATEPGTLLGTPAWMAPEQVRGEAVDHRADLWAVGVVLYECLTGRRAFAGGMPGVLTRILGEEPQAPSLAAPGLDPGWDAVLAQALAKSPEARFADAGGMAAAVRGVVAGMAATAAPRGLGALAVRAQSRPAPGGLAGGALAGGGLVGGGLAGLGRRVVAGVSALAGRPGVGLAPVA